jgi:hypothetical protein
MGRTGHHTFNRHRAGREGMGRTAAESIRVQPPERTIAGRGGSDFIMNRLKGGGDFAAAAQSPELCVSRGETSPAGRAGETVSRVSRRGAVIQSSRVQRSRSGGVWLNGMWTGGGTSHHGRVGRMLPCEL